jgi:dTDP-4-amino-4,6-dideoxygalactose transaminase
MITKKAVNQDSYRRNWIYTNSARDAWSIIIQKYKDINPNGKILLPSYIGWSTNEGSGIFDSVLKSGLEFEFYELGLHLEINVDDLKEKVAKDFNQLVLLVHYFGFIDTKYEDITDWLIKNKIFFVEDLAHSWLTDLIGGVCGRKGNYSFYSLHKLLPVSTGGIMVDNNPVILENNFGVNLFFDVNYDLLSIFNVRRANYQYLSSLLENVNGIDVIYKKLDEGVCPQTLPVIIENYDRDKLYQEMNEFGFGMVSLYHTMIKQLEGCRYQSASILSKKIINFPIHQDINKLEVEQMVLQIKKILNA